MKAFSFKEPWVRSYVDRLLGLSTATKKAIIDILGRSIEKGQDMLPSEDEERKRTEKFWSSFGAWEGDGTAEELAKSIRDARTENPDRESLD